MNKSITILYIILSSCSSPNIDVASTSIERLHDAETSKEDDIYGDADWIFETENKNFRDSNSDSASDVFGMDSLVTKDAKDAYSNDACFMPSDCQHPPNDCYQTQGSCDLNQCSYVLRTSGPNPCPDGGKCVVFSGKASCW